MKRFASHALAIAITFGSSLAGAQTLPQLVDSTGYIAMCVDTMGASRPCPQQSQADGAQATGSGSTAIGQSTQALGLGSVALGSSARAQGLYALAFGQGAAVWTDNGLAIGTSAYVNGTGSTAIGANASALGLNSVALGANSTTSDNNVVTVGSSGATRRITNVTDGIMQSDAATVGQLTPVANALGGGSMVNNGVLSAPTYTLVALGAAGTYHDVGSALTALDSGLAAVNARVDNIQLTPGPKGDTGATGATGAQGPQGIPGIDGKDGTNGTNGINGTNGKDGAPGATGPQGIPGIDGKDGKDGTNGTNGANGANGAAGKDGVPGPQGPKGEAGATGAGASNGGPDNQAMHYDDAAHATVALQGTQGTTIANLRAGVADTDAANVGQVTQQVQAALATAKSYTDASAQRTLKAANAYTDWAVSRLTDRITTAEAMGAAQTQMVASFAGADPANHNRIAAGVGFAGGHNGVSVGYQHVSEGRHTAWNIGGGVSGQERTVGAGASYSW